MYIWLSYPQDALLLVDLSDPLQQLRGRSAAVRNGIQWIKTWGGGAILGRSPETPCVSHLESEQFGTKVNVSTSEKV